MSKLFPLTWLLFLHCFRHALNVQIFIKMHRSDYAEKQLRVMQQIDEDHTLTQLASAWLNLAVVCPFLFFSFPYGVERLLMFPNIKSLVWSQGGSKIQEAYLIFQDFSEKYPMTSLILNGKAVCCMHMGNFEEAETLLLEALNKVSEKLTLSYLASLSTQTIIGIMSSDMLHSLSRLIRPLKLITPNLNFSTMLLIVPMDKFENVDVCAHCRMLKTQKLLQT